MELSPPRGKLGKPDDVQLAGQRLPGPQHPRLRSARGREALQDAKRVSLGFLYWLQTDQRAPELKLRPDVMGTADGLSKHPYIRESRRIQAKKTIVEQEVSAHHQAGPHAARFADSVGVGWYPIDIHRSGPDDVGASCRTKPFQIPLGALLAGPHRRT